MKYISWEESAGDLVYWAGGDRRIEGATLIQALVWNCGNQSFRCQGRSPSGNHHEASVPRRSTGTDRPVRARKAGNAAQAKGSGQAEAVGERLLATLTPMTLEVTRAVEQELQARIEEAEALRGQQVERARYEAELARRRYLRVDPDHRLVAGALEAEWNDKLRALQAAQEAYERHREADRRGLDEAQRTAIRALAQDFPRVWQDPHTPIRERKRLVRLLLEDVTLLKHTRVEVPLCFRGGRTHTLILPLAKNRWQRRQTDPAVIAEIDRLLEDDTDAKVAQRLNAEGRRPGMGGVFHSRLVARLRKDYGLPSRYERLRGRGLLTQTEIAERLGIDPKTVQKWRRQGRLPGQAYSDKPEYLYEDPGKAPPLKYQWQRERKNTGASSHLEAHSSSNVR